jgi:hypothetical protein
LIYVLFCSAKVMSEREDVPADFFSIATSSQVHLSPFAAQTRLRQQPVSQRRRGLAYITADDSSRRRAQKAGRSSAEQTAMDDGVIGGEVMQPAPAWLAVLGTQIHVIMYSMMLNNPWIK